MDELLGTVKAQLVFGDRKLGGSEATSLMNTRFIRHHIQSQAPSLVKQEGETRMVEGASSTAGFVQRFHNWFGAGNAPGDAPEIVCLKFNSNCYCEADR